MVGDFFQEPDHISGLLYYVRKGGYTSILYLCDFVVGNAQAAKNAKRVPLVQNQRTVSSYQAQ